MIYIVNKSTKPDYNIALEEYCFKRLLQHDKIFILWINEPAIIVGKHQNTIEEINPEYVKEHGIHVVRRISGGGAVYHDLNNLNYTIISNEDKGADFDFRSFSKPVIDTLAELGVKAEFTGRNDLVIDGKKICGNAQAYIPGRVMHHGCLLFNTDLTVLSKALEVPKDKIESKSVKSVRSVVDNILPHLPEKITINEFADKLLEQMKTRFPEMRGYSLLKRNWPRLSSCGPLNLVLGSGITDTLPNSVSSGNPFHGRKDSGLCRCEECQDSADQILWNLLR